MKKSHRIQIAKDTLNAIKRGYYTNAQRRDVGLSKPQKEAEKGTILYRPQTLIDLINEPLEAGRYTTTFVIEDLTSMDAVRQYYPEDNHLLCLNFASAKHPGGGFLKGSSAQEESIARASGLYNCQLRAQGYYTANRKNDSCLYTDHIIYSPNVPIMKHEDGHYMDEPVFASILTAPAVNAGVVRRNESERTDEIEPIMGRRIDMVLALCKKHGHKTLVLGAWGCGVFENDPKAIARMFDACLKGKYEGQFEKVIFAIKSKDPQFMNAFAEYFAG